MVKVTLNDNLVPSTRDLWVHDHPYSDLVHNYLHAKKLIRVAAHFFHLRQGAVIYSGYIREPQKGNFIINLWHEGRVVRSLTLFGLGYSGALHAEMVGTFEETVGWDLLGAVAWEGSDSLVAAAMPEILIAV